MHVPVVLQLGINGGESSLGSMFLDVPTVGATSSWAGSNHVLSMGRHYDDYVITDRILRLPKITGIPPPPPYQRLAGKIRAPGFKENLGEAGAALFARHCLHLAL